MAGVKNRNVTQRTLLKIGGAISAVPFVGFPAPGVLAQGQTKSPTEVLDFMTNADVHAEQEGQLRVVARDRPGTAGIVEGFHKDFPKINTSYVRARAGALYDRYFERSASSFCR